VDKQVVDVLIIGGGSIGATIMIALQQLGYHTLLVEAKPWGSQINPDFDARTLALSPSSQRILDMLGIWDTLQEHATGIEFIHVSEQHQFGAARLHAKTHDPLGYVVEMQHLNAALQQHVPHESIIAPATLQSLCLETATAIIQTLSGACSVHATLIIAADGTESMIREYIQLPATVKNYNQHALVANIGLEEAHQHKAYERFTPYGPLALLPISQNRMSLIWANASERTHCLMTLSDTAFLQALHEAFGYRLGRFTKVGKRFSYPLKQVLMPKQAKWPVVFLGNSAHTLHPIAGQGFNLALRDAASMAQCINQWGLNPNMLQQYARLRHLDQQVIMRFTDGLVQLFGRQQIGAGWIRAIGLIAFDNTPFLKKILARFAQGFGGITPDLVCQIALSTKEGKL
jgi:2-octaprenyl-6-methoxyphenol hydroxylase